MTFICNKTIYEQVYDHFCDDIIKGTYKVDDLTMPKFTSHVFGYCY